MTDDIVTRLRQKYAGQLPICTEAADEIERLRADRDKWRKKHDRAQQRANYWAKMYDELLDIKNAELDDNDEINADDD